MVTCKETRAAIIALHKNGFTGKDIVATKIAPKLTIYRIIKNFKGRGSILVKKASGRPRKSSKRQDRLLKRIQLRDRSATSAELAQEWQQAGVSASARTVRPRLLEDGLVSRKAAKKPLLFKKNIRDRLIFCKKYGEWTAEDWGKVIFSDEASFRLFGASGKRLVRRRKVRNTRATIRRYLDTLEAFKKGKSMKAAFDAIGVDRNTIAQTAIVAELHLAAPDVLKFMGQWNHKTETLSTFTGRCRSALTTEIKEK
ncbi:transposase-like protein [Labeo rohita]|uniref:Transposase-like protein n=1 Tax=Labeo rohita TaxID=84645 RepID=A0A498P4M3_LABRO|nr:transposase-like protein [Labeo rohita]